jgi:hypothetical protein
MEDREGVRIGQKLGQVDATVNMGESVFTSLRMTLVATTGTN